MTTRVAIAGSGGLAYLIAHFIQATTPHPVIMFSRSENPELTSRGFTVQPVDYTSQADLTFHLLGITTLISTIPNGATQLALINASISAGVRRFAAAEFQGLPSLRPTPDDLDTSESGTSRAQILAYLHSKRHILESTIFSCGILYEHFAPGGLLVSSKIGSASPVSAEGSFLMHLTAMTAEVPYNARGERVMLRLSAAQDVGAFVAKAIDMPVWPDVLTMSSDRLSVEELVRIASATRGLPFAETSWRDGAELHAELALALARGDMGRYGRVLWMLAALEGRFDFDSGWADANGLFPQVRVMRFGEWLRRVWEDTGS